MNETKEVPKTILKKDGKYFELLDGHFAYP